jgi:hypothetical protein
LGLLDVGEISLVFRMEFIESWNLIPVKALTFNVTRSHVSAICVLAILYIDSYNYFSCSPKNNDLNFGLVNYRILPG